MRTHATDAAGSPAEIIAALPTFNHNDVGGVIELAEGHYLVEAAWPAGNQVPGIYNYLAWDAPAGDTVARLRPVKEATEEESAPATE